MGDLGDAFADTLLVGVLVDLKETSLDSTLLSAAFCNFRSDDFFVREIVLGVLKRLEENEVNSK